MNTPFLKVFKKASIRPYLLIVFVMSLFLFTNCGEDSSNIVGPSEEFPINIPDPNTIDPDTTDSSGTASDTASSNSSFVIFDGTRFRDNPEMAQFGFEPIEIIYAVRLWEDWSLVAPWELPSHELLMDQVKRAKKINNDITVLDIEHWPLHDFDDPADLQKSLDNYLQVLEWVKEAAPNLQVGYWDTLPIKKRYMSIPLVLEYYQQWQENNDKLIPLAEEVDVFYPHLYTYSQNQEQWVQNAKYTILEARRYSEDKPVYAFLWPQYYAVDQPGLEDEYIDADFWRLQLETARKYADGVVIWFPYKTEWDEASNAAWWSVTKEFLDEMN